MVGCSVRLKTKLLNRGCLDGPRMKIVGADSAACAQDNHAMMPDSKPDSTKVRKYLTSGLNF